VADDCQVHKVRHSVRPLLWYQSIEYPPIARDILQWPVFVFLRAVILPFHLSDTIARMTETTISNTFVLLSSSGLYQGRIG